MKLHSSAILLGALTLMVLLNAVQASTPARRFASPNADVLEQLCHRVHLLPIDSLHRARALQSCKNLQETVPHQLQSGPTKDKVDYGKVLEGEKAKYITKTQSREPTPQELANLKALDEAQAKAKKVADDIAAAAATRKSEAVAADQQFMQDQLARQEQMRQQLDDHLKTLLNERNKNAAADAVRQDQLDVDAVANAKAKWTEYEKSLASAKASSAADAKVLESYDAKLKEVQTNWERDAAQRKADFAEAENDKKLADDAAKAARAKAREDRATEMDMRAKQREQDMTTARAERDAALERQRLVDEEAETRAKLKAEQDDAEAALVKNRKNRQDEEAERQKQMDAYAKEEANIKRRREEFEKAEKEREIRAKKRAEDEELRLKAKEEEDLRLAKAREDAAPHEERSKQDGEDDCTDKSVSCGSGKCFQLKSDPKSKRCQCQKGDKGKNCEHAACEYDLDDGAGKKKKQAGNMVNGQCVRWKSEYRCTCDKPWRLDVACVKKEGVKEIEVPKTECKGIREPENEFADQICELCLDQCPISRNLVENATAVEDHTKRRLAGAECDRVVLTCDGRMALSKTPYERPAGATSDSSRYALVDSKRECFAKCLERNGVKRSDTLAGGVRWTMTPKTHCTWVYFEPGVSGRKSTCYFFFTGKFPDQASTPNKKRKTDKGAVANNPPAGPTGFIAFVVYPRRWEMFRQAGEHEALAPKHFCGGLGRVYDVYFGQSTATTEGEGTYATTKERNLQRDECIAEQDTVLENAEGYRDQMNSTYQAKLVGLPSAWSRYGQRGVRPPADLVSRLSGVTYKYTVDGDFRVSKVAGVSTGLHTGVRIDEQLEKSFNWVNIRKTMDAKRAPFCAGHLIAYQQRPPNFYFNYVPQNENSNSLGCWYKAEIVAANLLQLGCHLDYNIDLDYGKHGILRPGVIKANLPGWARDNPSASRPPKARTPKSAGPGLPPTPRAPLPPPPPSYTNDRLKCHYRYRPYIMNLDFRVVNKEPNTHCVHLHHALTNGPQQTMLRVEGDRVISTRVYAYLLEKEKKRGLETGAGTKSLARLMGAATAMKKQNSELSCYAETGNNADFKTLEMDLAFFDAYIGNTKHDDCLRGGAETDCRKWSMTPEGKNDFGVLYSENKAKCLGYKGNQPEVIRTPSAKVSESCATFKYVLGDPTFKVEYSNVTAIEMRQSIEQLVLGTVEFDGGQCLSKNWKVIKRSKTGSNCVKLRVNYYISEPKRRRLTTDDGGVGMGDDDAGPADDTGEEEVDEEVDDDGDDGDDEYSSVCRVI